MIKNNQKKMYLVDMYKDEYIVKDNGDIDIIHTYFHSLKKTNSSIKVLNENHENQLLSVKEIISYFIVENNYMMVMLDQPLHKEP